MYKGFIALFSVLTLSGILLVLTAFADYAAYRAHEAVTDEYSYRKAQLAAFSCTVFAFERLSADSLRFRGVGTTTIQMSDDSICQIATAYSDVHQAEVLVQGESAQSRVRMKGNATRTSLHTPFSMQSWEEY